MPLTQHEKDIMEHKYSAVVFTGSEGLKLLGRLTGYIGKATSPLKDMVGINFSGLAELGEKDIGKVISTIAQMLPELMDDAFVPFVLTMFKYTLRDGTQLSKQAVFDEAYAGNYPELFAALAWIIYINYGEGLKEVFTKALDQLKGTGMLKNLNGLQKASKTSPKD